MKIVLDTCVWGGAKTEILAAGHDVVWIGDLPNDPGDDDILAMAHAEFRVLVTLDKDFGELAVRFHRPHFGIIRLVNIPALQQGAITLNVVQLYADELTRSSIITVESGRIRIRSG